MLLDITETNFWTFGSTFFIDLPSGGSGAYNISNDPIALLNVTNAIRTETVPYKLYSPFGYYDTPLEDTLKPIKISKLQSRGLINTNATTTPLFKLQTDNTKISAFLGLNILNL